MNLRRNHANWLEYRGSRAASAGKHLASAGDRCAARQLHERANTLGIERRVSDCRGDRLFHAGKPEKEKLGLTLRDQRCGARLQAGICRSPQCPPEGGLYTRVKSAVSRILSPPAPMLLRHPPPFSGCAALAL